MNKKIRELYNKSLEKYTYSDCDGDNNHGIRLNEEKFAELIVRECIDKIETYRIPVGNSAAGEMACEWTYDALKEISDEIKERFGIE